MSVTKTAASGRLCNQIIRNIAVSLIAEKYNLRVDYINKHLIEQLGITLFSGENEYTNTIPLTDDNYFSVYNCENLSNNLNPNNNYFQTKEITNFLHNYLHSDAIKSRIINANPYKERYNNNNDVLLHIRLTDVARFNPGLNYYVNALKGITYDNIYITTDQPSHTIINSLLQLYPTAKIIHETEVATLQLSSTCKHIILSHGSFSAIIGYLAFFSTVYYPEYELGKIWYGDMFSINNWIKLSLH